MFVRKSKFRHVFGYPARKERCYEGLRVARTAHDPSLCAVNRWFLATAVESSGGGSFVVVPIRKIGRISNSHPKVCGHCGPITDLKWDPFDPCTIASGSEDCTVKVWRLTPKGLQFDVSQCRRELQGHSKRIALIEWHPTAKDVLLSASNDLKCIVWDVESGSVLSSISVHPDVILSVAWNPTGSLLATTCRDRRIRIVDPRKGVVVSEAECHDGSRASRVVFLKDRNLIFTTGFSRGSQRQIAVWNTSDLSRPVHVEDVDSSSGLLIPFYDPDTNIVYIAGKGDGNIRYYEINAQEPYVSYLSQYQSNAPQCGLGMMPKWGVDPYKCELVRFYKLHTLKDLCEPISMIAPRKSERFQEDIFPPTFSPEPALSSTEWLDGKEAAPKKVSMKDIEKALATIFPGFQELNDAANKRNLEEKDNVDGHETTQNNIDNIRTSLEPRIKDPERFQTGKVKQSVGLFESEHLKQPAAFGPTTVSLSPPPKQSTTSPAADDAPELKTSSYHLMMTAPNDTSAAAHTENDRHNRASSDDVFARNTSSDRQITSPGRSRTIILRHSMTATQSPSSSLPDKKHPPAASHQKPEAKQVAPSATDHNSNDRNHYLRVDGKEPVPRTDDKRTENKLFWERNKTTSRSKSLMMEPGRNYRYSRHHSESVSGHDDANGGGGEWEAEGMIDFISTDAPDDTVVKPSVLRSSMRSRRRTKNIAADQGGPMYRRAASMREPRTRRTGRPVSLQASSSVRADDRRLLLPKEAGNQSMADGNLRSVVDRYYFADRGSSSGEHRSKSELGLNRAVNMFSHSPLATNPSIKMGSSRAKDSPEMERSGSVPIIRSESIYQRRLRYERPPPPPHVGFDGNMTPKSQENVIATTTDAVVMPTSHNRTHDVTTAKHDDDEWNRRNRRAFDDDDDEYVNRNRKHGFDYGRPQTASNGEFAADKRHSMPLRSSLIGDGISPPTDYDALLSLYYDKVHEIQYLRNEVLSRDLKIQQLVKLLRLDFGNE